MSRWTLALTLSVPFLLLSCGGGGGGTPTSVSPFVPNLENDWRDSRDANHTFNFFNVDNPGQEVSNFAGNEHPNGQQTLPLEGRYMGRTIQFTVHRAATNVSFSGQFTSLDRMELSSPTGNLVLCSARLTSCS